MDTFFDEIIKVDPLVETESQQTIIFGVKSDSRDNSNLYKLDMAKKEFIEFRKSIGSILDYNKLSTDPFGKYLAVLTSKTSFFVIGDIDSDKGADIGGNIRVETYNISEITGIRFFGPNQLVVVGVNGIMVGFNITEGQTTSSGKKGYRSLKFLWKRLVQINKNEMIDTYDVITTGMIYLIVLIITRGNHCFHHEIYQFFYGKSSTYSKTSFSE